MAISRKIEQYMTKASWIRKMFEEGGKLRARYGEENVFDYTLGNPIVEPPALVKQVLRDLAEEPVAGMHRYMSNAGYESTRTAVARYLSGLFDLPFDMQHIVMTVGAGGGLNVTLKALLNAGDEVIINSPFFVEYKFYLDNHGGMPVVVPTSEDFALDPDAIRRAITAKTRVVLVNSPNNPTGVIYSRDCLAGVAAVLREAEETHGAPIYLVSDEPYRKIVYDGADCPSILHAHPNSIIITSHSKDLALPGERIGYIAVNPALDGVQQLMNALIFCNRTLGFVNAPALQQRIVERCVQEGVDIGFYQEKRDMLFEGLTALGYEVVKPQGTFYMFPRSPLVDDVAFVNRALAKRLLLVPGAGFGTPGYFRIAYCTVQNQTIERSLPIFAELIKASRV
ncbi:pyridoxal phosphate-dependent aminotransferase [bacterium]|nr:pyridoxal phosphate-dependent aminotransferase [candidate division CSSED10-310 bacterium]